MMEKVSFCRGHVSKGQLRKGREAYARGGAIDVVGEEGIGSWHAW